MDLRVSLGQFSDPGPKKINQDFHGAVMPSEPRHSTKGIAIALADGISSSEVSQLASEAAVAGFLEDYYSTPEAWSVKKSAQRVLMSINSWLYSQTRRSQYRYDLDRGYVCTLSALILKSSVAHLFHVGDSRIYRVSGNGLEQLTHDDRVHVAPDKSYLGAALGVQEHVELEYQSLVLEERDVFVLATDGVYEFVRPRDMVRLIEENAGDLDQAARAIGGKALDNGSDDNLTVQLLRVEALPRARSSEAYRQLADLPFPPDLDSRSDFDGYRIVREVHASHRSHVFLAVDLATNERVALKTLATELQGDPDQVERFLMEEWIARRLTSPHVAKSFLPERRRNYLYTVMEFIEGQTLTQWMRDHPSPELATVRALVEQIALGLRAFHRMEMIHQDLRPDNVMIDSTGTAKLIDFGSTRVAGLEEAYTEGSETMLGTLQYSAPEYFLGEVGTPASDIFSLGVISYQMLTGHLPYGTEVPQARTRLAQYRLRYHSARKYNENLPGWIDGPLRKALHPDPNKRYQALSEFLFDLQHARGQSEGAPRQPLIERNPLAFWKGVSLVLAVVVVILSGLLLR